MSIAAPLIAPIRVDRKSNGMSMTPEEFDAIEDWDENYRYELIRGVLIVSPPPGPKERSPNDELGYLIRLYRDTHPNGSLVTATLPEQTIKLPENRRRADRAIWIGMGKESDLDAEDTTPTIVVEFTGSRARDRRRDYLEKRQEYAALGIQEYWIVDRIYRKMTVYRGDGVELVFQENDVYRTELLPGFELPIARIL